MQIRKGNYYCLSRALLSPGIKTHRNSQVQQFAPTCRSHLLDSSTHPISNNMAVFGSLFVILLCSHLLSAGRIVRMTSSDDGQWMDDTNTRLIMGEDEQSQATGWAGE